MSVAPDAAKALDELPADYISARFVAQVTFRGVTVDSVSVADTASGAYRMTHTPAALVVQWWPGSQRPLERQVRLVPWANVCNVEPSSACLGRILAAHLEARTKAAPLRLPRQGRGPQPA